jgi:hypothetical protein
MQALHRARQRMGIHRTAVVSQIRGLLLDRDFAMAKSITRARRLIPEFLSDLIAELYDLMRDLDRSASAAARVQPRNGCGCQQERTDHLGRASNWRTVAPSSEDLPRVCETTEK